MIDSNHEIQCQLFSALFIQQPDIDAVQNLYARYTTDSGLLEKIEASSLRRFLTETSLSTSGKSYRLQVHTEVPGEETVARHIKISRHDGLNLCMLDAKLQPVTGRTLYGSQVLRLNIFGKMGQMMSFEAIQSALNEIRQLSVAKCSNSQKDRPAKKLLIPTIPPYSPPSSRSIPSSSSYSNEAAITKPTPSTIEIECPQPRSEVISSKPILYSTLYVTARDCYAVQPIFIRETASQGNMIEITRSSLESFLKDTPLTPCGQAYDCTKIIDDQEIHYYIPRNHTLLLGVLDQKGIPIRNRFQILSLGICGKTGAILSVKSIQRTLESWPKQYVARKSSPKRDQKSAEPSCSPHRGKPMLQAKASPSRKFYENNSQSTSDVRDSSSSSYSSSSNT